MPDDCKVRLAIVDERLEILNGNEGQEKPKILFYLFPTIAVIFVLVN